MSQLAIRASLHRGSPLNPRRQADPGFRWAQSLRFCTPWPRRCGPLPLSTRPAFINTDSSPAASWLICVAPFSGLLPETSILQKTQVNRCSLAPVKSRPATIGPVLQTETPGHLCRTGPQASLCRLILKAHLWPGWLPLHQASGLTQYIQIANLPQISGWTCLNRLASTDSGSDPHLLA